MPWKVFGQGSNYRKPRSINFRKVYFETNQALKACIEMISAKNKIKKPTLSPWREFVLTIVKDKIKKIKQKIQL